MIVKLYNVKESGSNLSRLMYHLDNKDVCFITSFRGNYSRKENLRRNKLLALDIHNMGYSFIRVEGGYHEEDKEDPIIEDTFAVISDPISKKIQNEFFNLMIGLCKKYEQDAVLISLNNREDITVASYNSNKEIVYGPFSHITTNNVEEFFTRIHGHKFKMESFYESEEGVRPNSFANASIYYGTRQQLNKKD